MSKVYCYRHSSSTFIDDASDEKDAVCSVQTPSNARIRDSNVQ